MTDRKPVLLLILDGYGINPNPKGNAIAMANTPVMDKLEKEYPLYRDRHPASLSVSRTGRWVTLRLDI